MIMNRKNTLIILAGISGSGKSTFAKLLEEQGWAITCPDRIRAFFYGDESIQGDGNKVFQYAFNNMVEHGKQGYDVVFDATNTTKKARKKVIEKARPHFDFILCYYFYPSLVKSMNNQAKRERQVPREVLARQINQWQTPTLDEGFDYVCEIKN
jgi:predicted kinase